MKRFNLSIRLLWPFLLIFALAAFTCCHFYFYLRPYTLSEFRDIPDRWESDGNTPAQSLQEIALNSSTPVNAPLMITRVLMEEVLSPTLMIKPYYQTISVFLDGVPIRTMSPNPRPNAGVKFIRLPPDYVGQCPTLELRSPYARFTGRPTAVHLGSERALFAYMFSQPARHLLFLFTCCLTGLSLMWYAAMCAYRGASCWDSFYFGLFSVLLGFFSISRDDLMMILLPSCLVSSVPIALHTVYLIPLMAYLCCFFIVMPASSG